MWEGVLEPVPDESLDPADPGVEGSVVVGGSPTDPGRRPKCGFGGTREGGRPLLTALARSACGEVIRLSLWRWSASALICRADSSKSMLLSSS